MAKTFRLQSVLEHKKQQGEQEALTLAALDAACRRTRVALEALRGEEEQQLRQLAALAQHGRLDAEQYRSAIAYLSQIEGSIAEQATAVGEAERRVLDSRDALVGILKEKRSLERLRERHVADAMQEAGRREAGQADDLTSSRYARRAGEGA